MQDHEGSEKPRIELALGHSPSVARGLPPYAIGSVGQSRSRLVPGKSRRRHVNGRGTYQQGLWRLRGEAHCRDGCDACLYCAGVWSTTIRTWPNAPCCDDDPHRQRRGRRNRGHRLDQVLRIGPSSPRDRSPDQARRDRRTSRTERSRQDDDDRHDPRPAIPRCRSGQRVRPPTG